MKLLGFYLGQHDSNMALYEDGQVKYFKSERMFQIKHHKANLKWVEQVCQRNDFIPDAIAYSDGNRNGLGVCEWGALEKNMPAFSFLGRQIPAFCIDHHYAHVLSTWTNTDIQKVDYGLSIDGRGDHGVRVSIFKEPGSSHPEIVFQSQDHAFCRLFNLIGIEMKLKGLEIDFAGKIMGAHAYGKPDLEFINTNFNDEIATTPALLLNKVAWRRKPISAYANFFNFECGSFRDWLSSVHHLLGMFVLDMFQKYVPKDAKVVYAGGGAQNTVFNQQLKEKYKNLVIPPHCYDGGLSLGCLEFLVLKYGLPAASTEGFPFWQNDEDAGFASSSTIDQVVEQLEKGKVIGWFQGKGAVGPRALGHRSILLNPTLKNGKDHINRRIKNRESWRPFAPSMLAAETHRIVDDHAPSPYMLRAVTVKEEVRSAIPAVVHVDGSSRIQTVGQGQSELSSYHELLTKLNQQLGYPLVLNTSLNAAGGPIVSSRDQAKSYFQNSNLDAICIGDELYVK